MTNTKEENKPVFNKWARLQVYLKNFYERFSIKKAHFNSLSTTHKKAIAIVHACIENPESKLYNDVKHGNIQIELPNIFITVKSENSFYAVDIVFVNQAIPTSDKVIFGSDEVLHIFDKFDDEVAYRTEQNLNRKNQIVDNHLDNVLNLLKQS